ncbi:MAG: protoporphyrinogen oxidase [Acidobacteriota bacterium]
MNRDPLAVDAIVIGGGIAGLSVAYELQRQHVPFVVLERSGRAGGVILSEDVDGYTIDAGPDALLVQKPDGIKLCEELGLGPELVPTRLPRLAYVQRGNRLHPLPAAAVFGIPTQLSDFLTTRLFSWRGKARMAAELFVPPRRDDADESIASFMTRRFGAEATTYLAEPLLAGIHAGDAGRLSMRSLFPRLVEIEATHGSLLREFRTRQPDRVPGDGAFRSLPGGLSQMIRALTAVLGPQAIRFNAAVRRVAAGGGHSPFQVETDDGTILTPRAVVCATPAFTTGVLVRELDAALAALCGEIPYASTGTVILAFRRQDIGARLDGSGFVVPRVEQTGILAASWLSSKWPHRAPADRVLMRTFVGGARDPRALERPDDELVDLSIAALTPLIGISGPPLLTRVYRWERASAQHEVGHERRMAAIERSLARRPGLFITGSGFRGVGIPDCVKDGRATAQQVARYLTAARPDSAAPERT